MRQSVPTGGGGQSREFLYAAIKVQAHPASVSTLRMESNAIVK